VPRGNVTVISAGTGFSGVSAAGTAGGNCPASVAMASKDIRVRWRGIFIDNSFPFRGIRFAARLPNNYSTTDHCVTFRRNAWESAVKLLPLPGKISGLSYLLPRAQSLTEISDQKAADPCFFAIDSIFAG